MEPGFSRQVFKKCPKFEV